MRRTWMKKTLMAIGAIIGTGLALLPVARAVTMQDYTSSPPFVSQTVPPNILFIVDLSDTTIPAAYGNYPISAKSGTVTLTTGAGGEQKYASNVNLVNAGNDLISSSDGGVTVNTATTAAPSDVFDPNKNYFGLFDPFRCYVQGGSGQPFTYGSVKTTLSAVCGASHWDGNFLNWFGMRKKDVAYQVLVGGTAKPAQSNVDGTSDKLESESTTGENGTNNVCNNDSSPCWRYVKWVPATTLVGRVPTSLPADSAGAAITAANGGPGRFFGSGEGKIYVNQDSTADPFDGSGSSAPDQLQLGVDLRTEPDVPSGTGSVNDNCTVGDPLFAGHLVCYKRDRSLGLFQKLRTDSMHVAVMFANANSAKAGTVVFKTDDNFNASAITNIRNAHIQTSAPLAESLYEGLCYYRNSQGACYNNNPADFTANVAAQGDPFFFVGFNQTVSCCKSFVLMISPGAPSGDDNAPDVQTPFGNLFTGAQVGLTTTRLDDVALFGQTHDVRDQTSGPAAVPGTQKVTFYAVNAMGGAPGATVLSSAAKFGGFVDQDSDGLPQAPQASYTCTFPAGSSLGTGASTSSAEWDLNKDCIPDTFFDASEGGDLENQINRAIADILKQAASGTSAAVLATSSTGAGAVYQAYFFPTTSVTIGSSTSQVTWTGAMQGLFVDKFGNLREDYSLPGCTGPPDGKLILEHDCIVKFRLDSNPLSPTFGQVLVDRFRDDNGDGIADTAAPFQTVTLTTGGVSNVQPILEAGRQLALLDPGTTCESANNWPKSGTLTQSGRLCRRILTWADLSNGGGVSSNEQLEVSTANKATLCPYLGGFVVLHCNGDNTLIIDAAAITADPSIAGCIGITRRACAQNEATGIINFVRGCSVSVCAEQAGLRNRMFNVLDNSGAQVQKVWKLGDIISSTPVVIGAPSERFDVIFGDSTYAQFFQRYKDRRQVSYVGANDGMLHAFNAGFFRLGDDPGTAETEQAQFTTTPKQLNSAGTALVNCPSLPCDGSVPTYSFRSDAPPLGTELWAFLPQDLLPQLRWMTDPNYTHVYYVDLKPKVTDARIFADDADHPGGWGTILIGGFRLGGSCTNCTAGKATPRVVNADFNYNGTTTDTGNSTSGSDYRVFLSSYFVLDITNPEKEPNLLWVFRDKDLGLTTAAPAIVRVKPANPVGESNAGTTGEKWYVVFGTGPTHYAAFSSQTAKFYVVDLKQGPVGAFSAINQTSGSVGGTPCSLTSPCIAVSNTDSSKLVRAFSTGQAGAFMGDAVALDFDLNFRADSIYAGSVICNGATTNTGCTGTGPVWRGAMWRLTTNGGNTDPNTWGIVSGTSGSPFGSSGGSFGPPFLCPSGGPRCPTPLISAFTYSTPQATTCVSASPCNIGPITAAPSLTSDDTHNIWVFFGTGRYYDNKDKAVVDIQHFFGVKDSFITLGSPAQTTERNNLFNSSNIVVCSSCAPDKNVSVDGGATYTKGFDTGTDVLLNNIQGMDGWFTTFSNPPNPLTPGERNLSTSVLIGGTLFFTTFTPPNDICQAQGTGLLYALYYQTGGPYKTSALGDTTSGDMTLVKKSIGLGQGLPSQMAIQIGALGTGALGTSSSTGCSGRITGFIQTSTDVLVQPCVKSAFSAWSRMLSWRDL